MDWNKLIKRGRETRPRRVLLYGEHGVGKSTWPSTADAPLYVCIEDGLADLGVDRTPMMKRAAEVHEMLVHLGGQHEWKTVVLDTLDWLERLVQQHVCEANNKKTIEDFGYGRGYTLAAKKWEMLLRCLDAIHASGRNVVLLAHAKIERFSPPDADPYDRWTPDLHKSICPLIQEWVDEVLFATFRVNTVSTDATFGEKRTRAIGSGERVVYTHAAPTHAAKRRIELPDELPLYWDSYRKHWPTGNGSAGNITGVVVDGSSKTKGK
jgi:hypothetical protein